MNFIKILSILTVRTSPQIESNIKITAQNIIRRRKITEQNKRNGARLDKLSPNKIKTDCNCGFLKTC